MCILIAQPAGRKISKDTLATCWRANSDGGGFMYARHGRIVIVKELTSFERWYEKYQQARKKRGAGKVDMVLHFRIATHGTVDEVNCHPHRIDESMAFAHNGILSNVGASYSSPVSDTIHFRNKILRDLPEGWLYNGATRWLIEDFIGSSKMIFLTASGESWIANERLGSWDKDMGCWFSNQGYKATYTPRTTTYNAWNSAAPKVITVRSPHLPTTNYGSDILFNDERYIWSYTQGKYLPAAEHAALVAAIRAHGTTPATTEATAALALAYARNAEDEDEPTAAPSFHDLTTPAAALAALEEGRPSYGQCSDCYQELRTEKEMTLGMCDDCVECYYTYGGYSGMNRN